MSNSKLLNITLLNDRKEFIDPTTVTFDIQLKKLHKRISDLNRHKIKECIYTPPSYIFGRPLYDLNEMLQYLYDQLVDNGLKVEPYDVNSIYISWKKEDLNMDAYNYQTKSNDKVVQDSIAIIEKPVTNVLKKGSSTITTTNFQTFAKVNHKGSNIKDCLPVNLNKY